MRQYEHDLAQISSPSKQSGFYAAAGWCQSPGRLQVSDTTYNGPGSGGRGGQRLGSGTCLGFRQGAMASKDVTGFAGLLEPQPPKALERTGSGDSGSHGGSHGGSPKPQDDPSKECGTPIGQLGQSGVQRSGSLPGQLTGQYSIRRGGQAGLLVGSLASRRVLSRQDSWNTQPAI